MKKLSKELLALFVLLWLIMSSGVMVGLSVASVILLLCGDEISPQLILAIFCGLPLAIYFFVSLRNESVRKQLTKNINK